MRRVIATEYLTLDGIMENPVWSGPYWGEDIARFKLDDQIRGARDANTRDPAAQQLQERCRARRVLHIHDEPGPGARRVDERSTETNLQGTAAGP